MQAWRIAKNRFANDRTGTGAALNGGRWNSAGVPVIYAGLDPSTAAMEKLLHTAVVLPDDLMLVQLILPESFDLYWKPTEKELPSNWNALPSSSLSARFGDKFVQDGKYLGLIVPSVMIRESSNIVLNPNHEAFRLVEMLIVRPFLFDTRLRPDE